MGQSAQANPHVFGRSMFSVFGPVSFRSSYVFFLSGYQSDPRPVPGFRLNGV